MTATPFPHLFSPLRLGGGAGVTVKNRIVSTGHHTHLAAGEVNRRLAAYHEARAAGGAGLIIAEVAAVHDSAVFSGELLRATDAACVAGYQKLSRACRRHGARVFGQLFHPGREVMAGADGLAAVAVAPSAVPSERFHTMPRRLSVALIADITAGYARAAGYLRAGGLDGVEIVASHGYLPAQFLDPALNRRADDYGGNLENRLRFLRGILRAVRDAVGDTVIGLRLSVDALDGDGDGGDGVEPGRGMRDILAALAGDGIVDYYNITAGTSATLGGAVHISPPMGVACGYLAEAAGRLRQVVDKPLLVAGRINQPHTAEQILAAGQADLCGMTRALLCDPQLPARAAAGAVDDIRACIGCNQSCIGRAHRGLGVSCIQYPEAGRELEFPAVHTVAAAPKTVLVAGGGPGGMKAASAAAARGHRVLLFERAAQLGGQALLAQRLPGREEFGGLVANFTRELQRAGVTLRTATEVTPAVVAEAQPHAVILATGGRPYWPALELAEGATVVGAWEVLQRGIEIAGDGASVAVADWRGDWTGIGLAEMFAAAGRRVRLCVNAAMPGEALPQYTRNHHLARLHQLGVEVLTHLRLFGADEDTAFFQHTLSGAPVAVEGVDSVVVAHGCAPNTELEGALEEALADWGGAVTAVGDCLAPRSAEEAVLEGLRAAVAL
ncbi:MAG: FAD-dependent oxidoreductase [Gammaproteobacteria bacterium]|nr:FAD-dependent oxidoreductase [Gammaproteobacteria bacterium]